MENKKPIYLCVDDKNGKKIFLNIYENNFSFVKWNGEIIKDKITKESDLYLILFGEEEYEEIPKSLKEYQNKITTQEQWKEEIEKMSKEFKDNKTKEIIRQLQMEKDINKRRELANELLKNLPVKEEKEE